MKTKTLTNLILLLMLGGRALSAENPVAVAVSPDKLLYDVGETAKIAVTVNNGGKDPLKGQLTVRVIWEMEETQTVQQEPIQVRTGEKKVFTANWTTVEVLGCEARAELQLDANTTVTGSEYFNVCRAKDALRVGIHTPFSDLFTFPEKAFLDTIPQTVLNWRRGYANLVEHYSWAPDFFADLAPAEENWLSNYWQNKTAIKTFIAEEHKHGQKSLSYVISAPPNVPGSELLRTHPEWFIYHPDGRPWGGLIDVENIDISRNAQHTAAYRAAYMYRGTYMYLFPNFSLKAPLDFGIQQLIASKKMFGWDGVRFDGHYVVWTPVCKDGRNNTGKRVVSGKEADAIQRANTIYTKQEVRKVFPDYLFMFNASTKDPDIAEICAAGGGPSNEPLKSSADVNSQWNSWKAFTQCLLDDADLTRARGGYSYAFINPPWQVCPNVDRIQYPLLFATTGHPWFAYLQERPGDKGGSHHLIQQGLFRFATRYSALLWGHGIQRVKAPESLVTVTPPTGTVWWKDFVYERPLANGRKQLVIHLINEPSTVGIDAEKQTLPAPINNITVKFAGKVTRAWVASPNCNCIASASPSRTEFCKCPNSVCGQSSSPKRRANKMKRLAIDQRSIKLVNASEYETGKEGVIPLRYPSAVTARITGARPVYARNVRMATGIEIQLKGNITEVAFHLRVVDSDGYGAFAELYRGDAKVLPTWRLDSDSREIQVGRFAVAARQTAAPLRLLLPLASIMEAVAVEVDDAAEVEDDFVPYDYRAIPGSPGLTWGVYGDSITQGANVTCPSANWVNLAARTLKVKSVNLAIGGLGVAEAPVADYLATRTDFDVLSLHMGANCVDADAFVGEYTTFLRMIREARPTIPIVMATPIVSATGYEEPGRNMARMRAAIPRVYESMLAEGDQHLSLIDGLSLLSETNGLNVDGVHIHEYSAMRMAERLVPQLDAILNRESASNVIAEMESK